MTKKSLTVALTIGGALVAARPVRAHGDAATLSAAARVLPSGPRTTPFAAAFSSGYGYTESVLGGGDSHHRLLGSAAFEGAPASWLGVGLRLDGRYDRHDLGADRTDDGWTGEPRLLARVDRAVGPQLNLGARLSVWLPGQNAPSLTVSAATMDLLALASYAPGSGAVTLTANAGYRVDRSAKSAGNASSLGPGDRLSLGVSAFDAALLGVGVAFARQGYQLFGEWAWDLLVGSGAPSAAQSPMYLGAGARMRLGGDTMGELAAEVSPGARPAVAPGDPLVPVPPRLAMRIGLLVALGAKPAPAPVAPLPPVSPAPPGASLEGELSFGGAIPADARITVRAGGREKQLVPDARGRFTLQDLPAGPAEVRVEAEGFEPATTTVTLTPGKRQIMALSLDRRLPPGQIRGTVRALDGRAVNATIRVRAQGGTAADGGAATNDEQVLRADKGAYQIDVQPGTYEVSIEAPGYQRQSRVVKIEQHGVTLLNAELRRAR